MVLPEPPTGREDDLEFRRARGRHAASVRNSLANHIRHVIERAGELDGEQVAKLRALLPPVDEAASDG